MLDAPPPCRGAAPVGAADGPDVGANVKSRPPRALAEGLIVGISTTRNPVGVNVGGAVPAESVLGAGEDVEYEDDAVLPPLSCPRLLSRIGLGIGTPTETGGSVGVDARGECPPLLPEAPGVVGLGLDTSPPRPLHAAGALVHPVGLGVGRPPPASAAGPAGAGDRAGDREVLFPTSRTPLLGAPVFSTVGLREPSVSGTGAPAGVLIGLSPGKPGTGTATETGGSVVAFA